MQHIAAIEAMKDELIAFRRDLHAHPELGHSEFRTAEKIASALDELGIEVHRNVAGTGVIGVIKGKRPGKVVALRADMDALARTETAGDRPWRSTDSSCMHGCGHDGHATMLMGAARYLAPGRWSRMAYWIVSVLQKSTECTTGRGCRRVRLA